MNLEQRRKKNAESAKRRAVDHKSRGLCCHCEEKPKPGHTMCERHLAMLRKCAANRQKKRIASSLCVDCGRPLTKDDTAVRCRRCRPVKCVVCGMKNPDWVMGSHMCSKCYEEIPIRRRKRLAKERAKFRKLGTCLVCGKPREAGYTTCPKHREAARKSCERRHARLKKQGRCIWCGAKLTRRNHWKTLCNACRFKSLLKK